MQLSRFFIVVFVTLAFGMISCGNEKSDSVRDAARQTLPAPSNTPAPPPIVPPGNQGNAVNTSVHHYICPNNCEGSGGATSGTCPVCGTEYIHNQEYHNTATPPGTQVTPPAGGTVPPPTTPEPAQNAAGVWHYTCGNGCAGGAGSAGNCATCGAALVHNQAYHN